MTASLWLFHYHTVNLHHPFSIEESKLISRPKRSSSQNEYVRSTLNNSYLHQQQEVNQSTIVHNNIIESGVHKSTNDKEGNQWNPIVPDVDVSKISEELHKSIGLFALENSNKVRKRRNSESTAMTTLHTVTYASHHGIDDRFCRVIESAIRYQHDILILGWDQSWKGLAQKLVAAYDFAASLPPTDLLLFTDAFDVAFTNTPSYIEHIFLKNRYDILFSAECGCWPHLAIDANICENDYPKSPTPYRFLNSGAWIGYAGKMRNLLRDVLVEIGTNFTNANDQKLIADFFLYRNQLYNISLDYNAEIFQSMHRSNSSSNNMDCNPSNDMILSKDKEWINKRTDTVPAILHFNGGGKKHHLRSLERLWYKSPNYYHVRTYRDTRKGGKKLPGSNSDGGGRIENQRLRLIGKDYKLIQYGNLCSDYLQREKVMFSL